MDKAIHSAMLFENFTAITDMLLARGLNINDKNYAGETILHRIAPSVGIPSYKEKFDFLLSHKADLEGKGNCGETPLLYTILHLGFYDSIKNLVDSGAKIDARDYEGSTALHYVIKNGGRNIDEIKNIVNLLIEHGLDINVTNNTGDTALHTIARESFEQEKVINFLVEKGADPSIRNDDGKTPLELAKEKSSPNAQFFEKLEKNEIDGVKKENLENIQKA